jgi:orotate phosphoribosyltransferase
MLSSVDGIRFLFDVFCFTSGRKSEGWINTNRFSTAAAVEELITPQVSINYTQHLINGQFVDSASGMFWFIYTLGYTI